MNISGGVRGAGSWAGSAGKYIAAHKGMSVIIAIVLVGGLWWGYSKVTASSTPTQYVLGVVTKGTIVASVSASGQVSASNQLDIKPKASGDVVYIGVKAGQYVKAGTLIAQLDDTTAQKSVRDAQANLESAQLSLRKLQKPATALTVTQAQNALSDAQDALTRLYSDSSTDVTNAYLELPDIITGLQDVLIGSSACGRSQWNLDCYKNAIEQYEPRAKTYRDTAYEDFTAAKRAYDTAFNEYHAIGNNLDNAAVEKSLSDTNSAVVAAVKAVKSSTAFIQLYQDTLTGRTATPVAAASTAMTNLNVYTGTLNTHASALLSDINSFKQDKQAIVEKQQSLDQTLAGADSLDLQSSELSVTKAQNSLTDAKNSIADYYVRAPFSGTMAAVNVKKYDSASSGTAVATLVTDQKIAELSLNEVDAAKVKAGDKATLTFDAIDGLTLTGAVAEVSTIGEVTQGVVSYTVKIGFDSQDERIKSGMTANASIQTDVRQDVLVVPSSAVKTQNGMSYVQVFNPPLSETGGTQGVASNTTPQQIQVEVGISDDTSVEIISGIEEGRQIVTRTVSGTTTSAPAASGGAAGRGGIGVPTGGIRF